MKIKGSLSAAQEASDSEGVAEQDSGNSQSDGDEATAGLVTKPVLL
ncbi:unnamed protein product [Brassica oleracea var. botrytis]